MKDVQSLAEDVRHPVVITGLGAISPYGYGFRSLSDALDEQRTGLSRAGATLPGAEERVLGIIHDLSMFQKLFPKMRPPLPIRQTRLLLMAALDALTDAGLDISAPRTDVGVMAEDGGNSASVAVQFLEPVLRGGARKASPLLYSQSVANASIGAVATQLGLHGPYLQTRGGGALLLAHQALEQGDANAILVGGFDEVELHGLLADESNGFLHLTASPEAYRPYQAGPGLPTRGEGAVCLLLETAPHARSRGARIYAELCAIGQCLDKRLTESPDLLEGWGRARGDMLEACVRTVLQDAGPEGEPLLPHRIDAFLGGGNGVPAIDGAEQCMLEKLGLSHLPLCSLKGYLGEGFGLAMALSMARAAELLYRGRSGQHCLVTNIEFHLQYRAAVLCRERKS